MQFKYHDEAEKKGIHVIGTCGFDSIPADMGVVFAQENFAGGLGKVLNMIQGGTYDVDTFILNCHNIFLKFSFCFMKINSWLSTTGFVDLGLGSGLVDCIATSSEALYSCF